MSFSPVDQLAINTIRCLTIDAIQKANSGHPGMPMGCAPLAHALYTKYMNHNPNNPNWLNRDRFVLSAGHGSMLLYSTLHLCGYKISLDDLKNFRQWESITAGHPEYGLAPGVETTTGPLGQGFANAVGMAIAQEYLGSVFNKDDIQLLDHFVYSICGDGDIMEGISHESASLAGHLKLGKLIMFYDDNGISIDGSTDLTFSEDVEKRFEAYGWQVLNINDVNDLNQIDKAVKAAQAEEEKPSLIITKTHIGFGSPNKQDTAASHGSPLGEEEIKLTKKNLNWREESAFFIPPEVYDLYKERKEELTKLETVWNDNFEKHKSRYPDEAEKFINTMNGNYSNGWESELPTFTDFNEKIATRKVSGEVLNSIAKKLPGLIGGSADLAGSNNTTLEEFPAFSAEERKGRNFHFGIREHGMGGILNGMALYGGVIPYGGTFLIFSDYMRPSIRLAALSHLKPIYIFTHDSIGLGEDGPTHQPIEQLASLRTIPGLIVIRPADANETVHAWKAALNYKGSPAALILTRQKLPVLDRTQLAPAEQVEKGAYILKDCQSEPGAILLASGSEVNTALLASDILQSDGINVRVVSFPSWELFEKQPEDYKESVLPPSIKARVSVEAGVKQGWEKYVGDYGDSISIEKFGASAPADVLFKEYGFTPENIVSKVKKVLHKIKEREV
ncbi:MAG: transketolase [Candidatus Cloacimonadota bacterium]|nr:MAG: transketolase [Candidatus Cloacimonadota bacterium]